MRILALTNLYPPHYLGGYELICYMVVNALKARGHDVQVLTSNHAVPGRPTAGKENGIERSLKIHGFYGHPWLGFGGLRHIEAHNNKVLLEAIQRHQPELVYVWNMGGISKSMVLTLQRLGIPTVYYLSDHWIARGFDSDVWIQWWNRENPGKGAGMMRKVAGAVGYRRNCQKIAPTNPPKHVRFQRLYFCSKALRKLTASAGFEVMHGAVIYPPVETERFNHPPKPETSRMTELLWVGRLAADKGVMTALKAMQLVQGKFEGTLDIYGSGDVEYTSELKEFVKTHNLPVRFASAGMEAMPEIYKKHDGLLFTSEWAEPFALTPLEAMASGLPVIGTLTGGSREIFRHKDNAMTYNAGNAEDLARQIVELAESPALRARIAQTGYDEVRANYALPTIVNQIEAYLQETLEFWVPQELPDYDR